MKHEQSPTASKVAESRDSLPINEYDHQVIQRNIIDYCTYMDRSPFCVRELTIANAPIADYKPLEFKSILGNSNPEKANLYLSFSPHSLSQSEQREPNDFRLQLFGFEHGSQVEVIGDNDGTYWLRPMHDATHNAFWLNSTNANSLSAAEVKMLLLSLPKLGGDYDKARMMHPDTSMLSVALEVANSLHIGARETIVKDTVTFDAKQPGNDAHVLVTKNKTLSGGGLDTPEKDSYTLEVTEHIDVVVPIGFSNNRFKISDGLACDEVKTVKMVRTISYTFSHNAIGLVNTGNIRLNLALAGEPHTANNERMMRNKVFQERITHLKDPSIVTKKLTGVLSALQESDSAQVA